MASLVQRGLSSLRTKNLGKQVVCWYTQKAPGGATTTPTPPPPAPKADAPVKDDNTKYQATQYYQYNPQSYYDIDVEMASDRIPQPSKYTSAKPKA